MAAMSPIIVPSVPNWPSPQSPVPSTPSFDSQIFPNFSEIFAKFQGKKFSLVLGEGRDSLKEKEFHGRYNGQGKIMAVILGVKERVFGGFTPGERESNNGWKADSNFNSFFSR
jgi:hypothetical protein